MGSNPVTPTKKTVISTKLVSLFLLYRRDLNPKRARGVERNNPVNCSVAEWCVVVSFVPSKVTTSRQGLRSKTVSRHSDQTAEMVDISAVFSIFAIKISALVFGSKRKETSVMVKPSKLNRQNTFKKHHFSKQLHWQIAKQESNSF